MTSSHGAPSTDPAIARFWTNYLSLLKKKSGPDKALRWYRLRAEQYIQAHPEKRLATHTPSDVTTWLDAIGRQAELTDWQVAQVADALKMLFCEMLKVTWCDEVDWDHWQAGSRQLHPEHPTLAREPQPAKVVNRPDKRESLLQHFPDLHQSLLSAIRVRGYSIRTEQTYLQWVERFFHFHQWQAVDTLSSTAIRAFLEYLAVKRNVAASTQNQALNALVFFFKQVLERDLESIGDFTRAKQPRQLPVVLTQSEVKRLPDYLRV
jgi:hypothetical protein